MIWSKPQASSTTRSAFRNRLVARDPSNAERQSDLSISLKKIGYVRFAQGNLEATFDAYNRSLQIAQQLAARDPSNPRWQRDVLVTLSSVGDVRLAQRNLEAALEAYNQSLAIREQLAAQDPSNAQWRRGLAISFVRVSEVLPEDRRSEAVELVQRAFTILVELARAERLSPPTLRCSSTCARGSESQEIAPDASNALPALGRRGTA